MADEHDYGAHYDPVYAEWMREVNAISLRKTGVSVFELPDWTWRMSYDAGDTPADAWRAAVDDGILQ